MLVAASVVLAIAPFSLAFQGAPSPSECLLFSLGLLPMGAAMLVARTGRLAAGHAVASGALVAIALTLFYAKSADASATIAWLIAAQAEAALASNTRLSRATLVIVASASGAIVASTIVGPVSVGSPIDGPIALVALAYVTVSLRGRWFGVAREKSGDAATGERWRAVTEALGDLVVGFDAFGSANRVSAACEGVLGLPHGELVGRGLFDHVHVADRPAFLTLIADAAHGETMVTATLRLRTGLKAMDASGHPEPRHIWIEMRAKALAPRGGVVAILRDVTVARQHGIDLEQAHRASEQAIRAKDHFLANMSHELRTPLNAIIGFSEMLGSRTMRPADPEKQREYAGIIHGSGQHLLAVVNAILDMSKIQSGTFAIIPEPFAIEPLIEQCCDMVRLEAQTGQVSVTRDVPANLEAIVGDKRACKQIVLNLLSNAVKFTPEHGHVAIKVRPQGNTLIVSVSDTGIGITASDLACLGDPFFQARSSFCRPYEGTGLGLSVVRGLLGLHGGTIAIESEVGKGTLVTVRLPLDCRIAGPGDGSARIETIPRRQPTENFARFPDSRMKSLA